MIWSSVQRTLGKRSGGCQICLKIAPIFDQKLYDRRAHHVHPTSKKIGKKTPANEKRQAFCQRR